MHVIYKISSISHPDRLYIGSAMNPSRRRRDHFRRLRVGCHPNNKLQNHSNKYGVDDLLFEIVEDVKDVTQLVEREQHYIDNLKPYFNLCLIAGSQLGMKRSDETKEKMRLKASRKRKPLSPEHRENVSKGLKEKRYGTKILLQTIDRED